MFVFYELEILCLLAKINKLLSMAKKDGYEFIVPSLQLDCYGHNTNVTINNSDSGGVLEIAQIEGFDEFLFNNQSSSFGRGLLYLLHACIEKNAILVIDDKENQVVEFANSIGVGTISISDFIRKVLRNESYIDFLINVKDEMIKIKS